MHLLRVSIQIVLVAVAVHFRTVNLKNNNFYCSHLSILHCLSPIREVREYVKMRESDTYQIASSSFAAIVPRRSNESRLGNISEKVRT